MTTNTDAMLASRARYLNALHAEAAQPTTALCDEAEAHLHDDHEADVCGWLTPDEQWGHEWPAEPMN